MSKDPERCCILLKDGVRCEGKPMYKVGRRGFCERHRDQAMRQNKSPHVDKTFDDEPVNLNRQSALHTLWPYFSGQDR